MFRVVISFSQQILGGNISPFFGPNKGTKLSGCTLGESPEAFSNQNLANLWFIVS